MKKLFLGLILFSTASAFADFVQTGTATNMEGGCSAAIDSAQQSANNQCFNMGYTGAIKLAAGSCVGSWDSNGMAIQTVQVRFACQTPDHQYAPSFSVTSTETNMAGGCSAAIVSAQQSANNQCFNQGFSGATLIGKNNCTGGRDNHGMATATITGRFSCNY